MDELKINDVVLLNKSLNDRVRKGYLARVIASERISSVYELILPKNFFTFKLINDETVGVKVQKLTGILADDVLRGQYILKDIGGNEYQPIADFNIRLKKNEVKINIEFKILNDLFKYIPISMFGQPGFYYNGNYIIKSSLNNEGYDPYSRKKKQVKDKKVILVIPGKENIVTDSFSADTLLSQCKFKIKDYKISSKLFGYAEAKKLVVGKIVEISKLEFQIEVKKSDKLENTAYINVDGKNLRFSFEDIEIIYPNVNGWNKTKDRAISIGSEVKIVRNKGFRSINKGEKVKVHSITELGNKKYVGFQYKDKVVQSRMNNFKLV